jgi:hypothetical protein
MLKQPLLINLVVVNYKQYENASQDRHQPQLLHFEAEVGCLDTCIDSVNLVFTPPAAGSLSSSQSILFFEYYWSYIYFVLEILIFIFKGTGL